MAGPEALIRRTTRNGNAKRALSLLFHRLTSSSAANPYSLHPFRPRVPTFSSPSRSRLFSPLSGLAAGPLFLSSPAWKLSQSATPLHFQGNFEILSLKHPKWRPFLSPASSAGTGVRRDGVVEVEDSICNFPNLISISRMVSGPFIGWMIINEWYFTSFVTLAISGMTDWLDGFVARRMNINSVLGSYLDPLADKVLICFVAVAMVKKELLPRRTISLGDVPFAVNIVTMKSNYR